ncbi:malto-oligosyltrehalose trehalohydrolase [Shinella sp.]|uniref:malto-oligosyltrehalose trehalohydrolase n=1 Tax=Shinella sp. TaxID=1870904 RepID=UPI003917B9F7
MTPSPTRRTWGPSITEDGSVRFRLWAPAEDTVTLIAGEQEIAMHAQADGWHEVATDLVRPGSAYFYRLPDNTEIADPASHAQLAEIEGPSLVVDHDSYVWRTSGWKGRPWEDAVIYELHIGTFTPQGTFRSAIERLPHLHDIGITAIEIMPVAHFAGTRGWGYDGVLHYAPHPAYGTPDDLKALVDAAHGHGIMVLLDVVYNHFGPIGNMLHRIAPPFFHPERHTPWGAALAFEREAVRRYFIDNALHWLIDYRFDGLRFDATEEIVDESENHVLLEMATTIRQTITDRQVHLVVEDQTKRKSLLNRDSGDAGYYTAGWNDVFHHTLHIIATREESGHYAKYSEDTHDVLRRATARGFVAEDREGDGTGPPPQKPLPQQVNINFLQNHDQIGNRAFGERLPTLTDPVLHRVMSALLLLAPPVPMLFMGEEFGESRPFLFFADFVGELAEATRAGRIDEAKKFGGLPEGKAADDLPDPNDETTFLASKLDWEHAASPEGRRHSEFVRSLVRLRQDKIRPLLMVGEAPEPRILAAEAGILAIDWRFAEQTLSIRANLTHGTGTWPPLSGETIFEIPAVNGAGPSIAISIRQT